MRQYGQVKTWRKTRDRLVGLPFEEFLDAICSFRPLNTTELFKIGSFHMRLVDRLDRALRALDGKLGRSKTGGPGRGRRGAGASGVVAMRIKPYGKLYRFGPEWMPDVGSYIYPVLFGSESAGISTEIRERLAPFEVALCMSLRVHADSEFSVSLRGDGTPQAHIGRYSLALPEAGEAFLVSREQPTRVDVHSGRSQGDSDQPEPDPALLRRLDHLIDSAAAFCAAVVAVQIDPQRPWLFRLVWTESYWNSWHGRNDDPHSGWTLRLPGIYFQDSALGRLTAGCERGELPSRLRASLTPILREHEPFYFGEREAWTERHELDAADLGHSVRFVLCGGPYRAVGVFGELLGDTRSISPKDLPMLMSSMIRSNRVVRQLLTIGERFRGDGYGLALVYSTLTGIDAGVGQILRPRSWWRGEGAKPLDSEAWWYTTPGREMDDVETGPGVIVWTAATTLAGDLTRLIAWAGERTDGSVTVVLLDTPETRSLVRGIQQGRREVMRRSSYAEAAFGAYGDVVECQLRPTLAVSREGDFGGDQLNAAVSYLDRHYGSPLSPWEVLTHPLLRERLTADEGHAWGGPDEGTGDSPEELFRLSREYVDPEFWYSVFAPMEG